ncbi:MAG: 2-oxoglutarate dehydrogenase complex dihydrolipoyllysine-residue succinyltransferase [Anaerolineae bacterium]
MPAEIKVPALGESVVEATVGQWLKNEGDAVKAGDVLVALETDKVNIEVAADQGGVLQQILRHAGDNVAIGDVLGVLAEAGAAPAAPTNGQAGGTPPPPRQQDAGVGAGFKPAPTDASPRGRGEAEAGLATPVARKLAEEQGVDLSQVPGSGPGGRATKEDVVRFIEQQRAATVGAGFKPAPTETSSPAPAPAPMPTVVAPPPATPPVGAGFKPALTQPPADAREERVRMTRRRQTIAQRLVEAQHTAAMLTTFNEMDMSAVMELRKKYRDTFQQRHGVRLGFMSFFVKATLGALKAFPQLNAEIQGDEIVLKRYYDIGVAVGAEGGLVVPVVRDADRLNFAQIEQKIEAAAEKARNGTLSIEDLRGGTFTITNGGVFGSLLSTPILNPPQVGILGLHKIEERPIARNGEVVIRPMMYVALTYDHRIVDGREAVQFLVRIKELMEDPERLLLEG